MRPLYFVIAYCTVLYFLRYNRNAEIEKPMGKALMVLENPMGKALMVLEKPKADPELLVPLKRKLAALRDTQYDLRNRLKSADALYEQVQELTACSPILASAMRILLETGIRDLTRKWIEAEIEEIDTESAIDKLNNK